MNIAKIKRLMFALPYDHANRAHDFIAIARSLGDDIPARSLHIVMVYCSDPDPLRRWAVSSAKSRNYTYFTTFEEARDAYMSDATALW